VEDVDAFRASTSLPVVGEIAALPKSISGGAGRDSRRGMSLFEESIDSLRTGIRLSRSLQDVRVLAVASAVSQEGKTSLASQLAISMARASKGTVLLIDADVRAPDVDQIFEIPNDLGLADVLAGEADVDEVIYTDYSPRLHLLPAGQLQMHPHELLGETSFREILARLKARYRYIIIDTPPILSASEALVFATHADASILCTRRGYSRVRQTREAYNRLVQADANPIGVVINGVPVSRYAYAYGQYRYRY
jgi:capsular exopolysaccharide synthesis family protein